ALIGIISSCIAGAIVVVRFFLSFVVVVVRPLLLFFFLLTSSSTSGERVVPPLRFDRCRLRLDRIDSSPRSSSLIAFVASISSSTLFRSRRCLVVVWDLFLGETTASALTSSLWFS